MYIKLTHHYWDKEKESYSLGIEVPTPGGLNLEHLYIYYPISKSDFEHYLMIAKDSEQLSEFFVIFKTTDDGKNKTYFIKSLWNEELAEDIYKLKK